MPMMVADRVLDSKKYSNWLANTGSTCGTRPKRMASHHPPPLASTPSTRWRCALSHPTALTAAASSTSTRHAVTPAIPARAASLP